MSTAQWKIDNHEHVLQHAREYYYKNKEIILQKKRNASPEDKKKNAENKVRYRQAHKEEISQRDLQPARRMSTAKSMAKKRGHIWNLSLEEYTEIIKNPCHYCANKLAAPVKKGSGLDRKDSNGGYTIDNVLSCCTFCNRIKSDLLTVKQTEVAIKAIIELEGK